MKVYNIILSCVLMVGLTSSCGSKEKRPKSLQSRQLHLMKAGQFLFDGTSTAGWRGITSRYFHL